MPDEHGQVNRLDAEVRGEVLVVKVNMLDLEDELAEAVAGVLVAIEVAEHRILVIGILYATDPVCLRNGKELATCLAVEYAILVQKQLSLRLTVGEQFLLDPGAVKVAEELVSAFL